jgi:exonuclease-1
MGISGLLPLLSSITTDAHISQFANKKVAIDIYCWLHKGAYSCSTELCQNIPTDGYITFCMKRLKLLLEHNVIPVVVFDGGPLPSKQGTEKERRMYVGPKYICAHTVLSRWIFTN